MKVQSDFRQEETAETLLEKLHDYIRDCDAVVCLAGNHSGSYPPETAAFLSEAEKMLPDGIDRASYTQWELHFARHYQKRWSLYCAEADIWQPDREPSEENDLKHQEEFRQWLEEQNFDYTPFETVNALCRAVLKEEWPNIREKKAGNRLPASIGDLFKGREEDLDRLRESLRGRSGEVHAAAITTAQAIYGLGGIGKTRLAIEFGHVYANDYDALFLIRADSPENFRKNLAELTGPLVLDLQEYTEPDEERRLAAALRWLAEHPRWFLIIDNVDTEEAAAEVEGTLQQLAAGDVVITSRLSSWSASVTPLDLSVLAEEDAIAFLLERTEARRSKSDTDEADARVIARKLDGLALALEQAGAYIAQRRIGFAAYLEHWESRREKVLAWHDERVMSYPASVAITWQTSFDEVGDDARHLLRLFAEFAPDPLPRGLVEGVDFESNPVEDARNWEDAFSELESYSLVRLHDEPPNTFTVHRLVQEIVRELPTKDDDDGTEKLSPMVFLVEASKMIQSWAPSYGQDISTWGAWTQLANHLNCLFKKSEMESDPMPLPHLFPRFGSFQLFRNASYASSEKHFRRALIASERDAGPDAQITLSSLENLAFLLRERGDLEGAEPFHQRSLETRERILGPEHPRTLNSVNNLGLLLKAKGNLEGAERLLRTAYEGFVTTLGPEHPSTQTVKNNWDHCQDEMNEASSD